MRYALTFLAFLLAASPAAAADAGCPDGDVRLQVTVKGVKKPKGEVVVTVYPDDAQRFLAKGGKVARVRVLATAPDTRVCLPVPASGRYAVAVYHDENGNRKFDRTMVGLPDEGYAFSNDADTTLGLPKFEAVLFQAAAGDNDLTVTMRY
ncbi:MAG TPA: DUF2141 domain-containing protein [Azospirillaceae bacterium]|nr:DUF2141 domain-containing protein [Azospirillaceae bacterium]